MLRTIVFASTTLTLASTLALHAQDPEDRWLQECRERSSRYERHCEVREYTVATRDGALRVDASPNGSVRVTAGTGATVRVVARVQTQAPSESEAREIAAEVEVVRSDGDIRSDGPRLGSRRSWSVSYDIYAPAGTDLRLSSTNGGLVVEGISGELDLRTTNGGIRLSSVRGPVNAETTNGPVAVILQGRTPSSRLDLETTNGGIELTVPEGYSAQLEASTTNGGIDVDFPVMVRGRIGRSISARLGDGGPVVRLRTTNGSISIRRP